MGLLEKVSLWLGSGKVSATVLVLGIDGAGKTALLHALRDQQEPLGDQLAAPDKYQSGGVSLALWDVCGRARLRALWERQYRRAHAIVYVVDAADHLRLVVAREELELALRHPDVSSRRLPLLLCANKSDAPHALPPESVAKALGLERVTDHPWHVCATTAAGGGGGAEGLRGGLEWLARQLRDIHSHK